jgi:hypothetical protein
MHTESPFAPLTGRCRCERVRFRLETAPIITHCCHCRLCQQFSGSAFRSSAMIETDRLTVLEGNTRSFHGARSHKQIQCTDCGCALWTHHPDLGEVLAFVGVGMLDQGERLRPEAHYFIRSKHAWIALPPDVPAFEENGDPGKAGARERIVAALASRGSVHALGDWARETPAQ